MPEKKVKKYIYELIVLCTKCGTVSESIGPCVKCENLSFVRNYIVKEVE